MVKSQQKHRKQAADVLAANISPIQKVRALVALGYDEDRAETMVYGIQTGQNQLVYYEQLPSPEYEADRK